MTILSIMAAVVVVDQLTKGLILRFLTPGVPVPVIDGFFALRLGFNPGLAFGLLADLHGHLRWLVTALSLVALVILARVGYRVLPTADFRATFAFGLIFGGAVGNLADRARHGAVVDFLDIYWRQYHWPAFNAADSAVTIGVTLLAATLMRAND